MCSWAVVAQVSNPSTGRYKDRQISELKAILVYKVSSRAARAKQRNHILKNLCVWGRGQQIEKNKKRAEEISGLHSKEMPRLKVVLFPKGSRDQ